MGASAGGLEALRGLVRNLPDNTGATFIIAQHMSPHHRSMLAEIIGRETRMKVVDATDRLAPRKNTIYITPPNYNVIVRNRKIHLVEPSREAAAPKPSVDAFLTSLAEEIGTNAIGIILSGTGSDGADGISAVRGAGGITIVQDELTAKYCSMPTTALETGHVDLVMSPEEIGVQFPKIIAEPRDLSVLKSAALDNENVGALNQLLLDRTRVNFRHYKTATFQRRVERRMAVQGVRALPDYLAIARNDPGEVDALFDDLLITVTSFFRDPVEFEALARYINEIVDAKEGEPIRVWIPGTATGEEAYTIAILFAEAFGGLPGFESARLQIFATDIDAKSIEIARRGYYSATSLDAVPARIAETYFEPAPAGYLVKKSLREKIVFSIHNIAQDPPFLNLDMISCRNLLIYFQSNLQAQVLARFHYALVPKGLLFLGRSESTTNAGGLFRVAAPDKHVFFQCPSRERRPLRDPLFRQTSAPKLAGPRMGQVEYRELAVMTAQFESLVQALGPNAVLIDGDLRVRRAFGDLTRYVGLKPGDIDTSALKLLKEPYRQDIRVAVPTTIRKKTVHDGVSRPVSGKPGYRENVRVFPIEMGPEDETRALVIFSMWKEEPRVADEQARDPDNLLGQVEDLGRELQVARTNLQHTVEELETSNEELQALNEELQSSNEELQSTNEELETSNEELQSTNEELATVNEELQVSGQQLKAVNQDLRAILENIGLPILVVDRGLRVVHASHEANTSYRIAPDVVQPHLNRCHAPPGFPPLVELAEQAMRERLRVDVPVSVGEVSATVSAVPNYGPGDEPTGAIIMTVDNTEELRQVNGELAAIFDNLPSAIMVRGPGGLIHRANETLSDRCGRERGSMDGCNLADVFDPTTSEDTIAADKKLLASGSKDADYVRKVGFKDGRKAWWRERYFQVEDAAIGDTVIYSVSEDITEYWNARRALALTQEHLEEAVRATGIGLWQWTFDGMGLDCSDRFLEMLGLDRARLRPDLKDLWRRVHPEDRDAVKAAKRKPRVTGDRYQVSYRLRHEDGAYRWVDEFGLLTVDEHGESKRIVGAILDITDERRRLWELSSTGRQMEAAGKMAGLGYWSIDLGAERMTWSEEVHRIHGTDPETFRPELPTAIAFYHPDDRARVRELMLYAVENGEPFEFTARLVRTDGEVRMVRSVGMIEDGRSVVGVFLDVTDKAREEQLKVTLEELSRSNEELNRFSYVCSHDMKEPVRMIENMAQLLGNREFTAEEAQREQLVGRIVGNAKRLRDIITSLLAYSRIEAKVEATRVDLNGVLGDSTSNLAVLIAETDPELIIEDLPEVFGARVHFTQLFQNLVGNALKFAAADGRRPKVRVSARRDGDSWVVNVEDNGPGVPEEHRKSVFSMFNRLHLRDEIEGTGLGLSICQSIVVQYGGTITCRGSELGGALFEVRLPIKETARAAAQA